MYDFAPILARLKEAKRASGMTNDDLSRVSGVSPGTLYKIMSGGTQEPKLPAMIAIAHALGVSVDYLIYGRTASFALSGDDLTEDERRLLTLFRQLNTEGRERLLENADDMVQSGKYIKSDAADLAAKEA